MSFPPRSILPAGRRFFPFYPPAWFRIGAPTWSSRGLAWHVGTVLYCAAHVLAILRLPFAVLPYLLKLGISLLRGRAYTTVGLDLRCEAIRLGGELATFIVVAGVILGLAPIPASDPWAAMWHLAIAAEAIRLAAEKGSVALSGCWQLLPHRKIARLLGAAGSGRGARDDGNHIALGVEGLLRGWNRAGGRLDRFRAYYSLDDEARARHVIAALEARAADDSEVSRRLSYVSGFRIVPDSHGLRAGQVRDVATGEIFIHRRWTNDPGLLAGLALRRSPWIFDPRYLRRPFYYRTEANPAVTLFVLRHARYAPRFAVFQFGHEIKAARFEILYAACRRLRLDLEKPVCEDGSYGFDPLLTEVRRLLGRDDPVPGTALWTVEEILAELRSCRARGEVDAALEIARRYTLPISYVREDLLPGKPEPRQG
jgi:hypothetical protein